MSHEVNARSRHEGSRACRRAGQGLVALLLALVGVVVAAPAARADDLPTGTFKMVSSRGGCATVEFHVTEWDLLRQECNTLNLFQQFAYDLLTKQIRSVGFITVLCVEARTSPFTDVVLSPCSNDVAGQKWQRELPFGGDGYNIMPYNLEDRVLSTAGIDIGDPIALDLPFDPTGPAYTWNFPLV
jgi:hypothetical protein